MGDAGTGRGPVLDRVRSRHGTRRLRIATVAAVALAALAVAGCARSEPSGPVPVFADEFSGTTLNPEVWGMTTPWNTQYTRDELQWYEPANVVVGDGLLRLESKKQTVTGKDPGAKTYAYTSGIVTSGARSDYGGTSRRSFRYGYFEMRAKLPKSQGMWPAFWLTNDKTHEIDVFELLGHDPKTVYMTYHDSGRSVYQASYTGPDFSSGFHTFAADWQPKYIRWYVDGVLRGEYTGPIRSERLWIVANTSVGGKWPGNPDATTAFPQRYDIDYIRVYREKPPAAQRHS